MIRDPSDGTVSDHHHKPLETRNIVGKSDDLITSLPIIEDIKAAILAGKVNPERLSPEWVYQRAWNDALDFALMQTNRVEKDHRVI